MDIKGESAYCPSCNEEFYDRYDLRMHERFHWNHELFPTWEAYINQMLPHKDAKALVNNLVLLTRKQWFLCFLPEKRKYAACKASMKQEYLQKGYVFFLPSEDKMQSLFTYA